MGTQEDSGIRAAWDALAAGFDEHTTAVTMPVADDVLPFADVGPGRRLLDVGSGSGAVAIPAARRGAEVLAVDISPAMIERLEQRAEREGLANIEGRAMDARALALDDGTFDVVTSCNGASILPEYQQALREMVRVAAPGGEVVVVNFGPPDQAEWLAFFLGAARAVVPDFAGPPPSPAFQLADAERMRQELREAGLGDARVEPVTWRMQLRSGEHLWNVVRFANPRAAGLVAGLTDEDGAAVRDVLDGMLREHAAGSLPATLRTVLNVGIGTR